MKIYEYFIEPLITWLKKLGISELPKQSSDNKAPEVKRSAYTILTYKKLFDQHQKSIDSQFSGQHKPSEKRPITTKDCFEVEVGCTKFFIDSRIANARVPSVTMQFLSELSGSDSSKIDSSP